MNPSSPTSPFIALDPDSRRNITAHLTLPDLLLRYGLTNTYFKADALNLLKAWSKLIVLNQLSSNALVSLQGISCLSLKVMGKYPHNLGGLSLKARSIIPHNPDDMILNKRTHFQITEDKDLRRLAQLSGLTMLDLSTAEVTGAFLANLHQPSLLTTLVLKLTKLERRSWRAWPGSAD